MRYNFYRIYPTGTGRLPWSFRIHVPVLLEECLEGLNIRPEGIYLDGTLGLGGHSSAIAARLTTGRLIGLDRDETAIRRAGERLKPFGSRVTLVHGNFRDLDRILRDLEIPAVDGMLFDLGVSSPQLDDGSRGFSYMADAPLDMRMNREDRLTAYEVVNQWSREELRRVFYEYGEERYAPQIAAAIDRRRQEKPIGTTLELVDVIRGAGGSAGHDGSRDSQPCAGRPSGGDHLSLSGGPYRQGGHERRGKGLHLPAGVSGMRLREKASGEGPHQKTGGIRTGGAGGESPRPQRQAAGL